MKKLMIAAATAALAAGAFAAEPQVYEMTLTVKTTGCATNRRAVTTACGDILQYRQQITRKYQGLFWGCGCQVIACPTEYFKGLEYDKEETQKQKLTSYLFWSATKGYQYGLYGLDAEPLLDGEQAFNWNLLQLVGPRAANIEGAWDLVLRSSNEDLTDEDLSDEDAQNNVVLFVSGAGYGTAEKICDANGDSRIKSMSGYVTGVNYIDGEQGVNGCLYCGEDTECLPIAFCEACTDIFFEYRTAVFGSWTLKYNSKAANKLAQGKPIEEAYRFPRYLNLGNYTDDEGKDEETDTVKTAAQDAYKTAKEAYETAKAALDAAQASITELQTKTETVASLTAENPTGTTQGLALAAELKTAQAAQTAANNKVGDATKGATKAAADAKTGLDTTMADKGAYSAKIDQYLNDTGALEAANEALATAQAGVVGTDFATEAAKTAAITAAKTAVQTAQANLNASKKAYEDDYAALSSVAKTDSDAYTAAAQALIAAQNEAADAAQDVANANAAINTWVTGAANVEGSKAKAIADARASLATLQSEANSKEQIMATYRSQCIAVGGTCN